MRKAPEEAVGVRVDGVYRRAKHVARGARFCLISPVFPSLSISNLPQHVRGEEVNRCYTCRRYCISF